MNATSRPLDSGRTDSLGRKIRVSGDATEARSDAPIPPSPAELILDELEAAASGEAPGSRYGTSPAHWAPVARAYAERLVESGFDPAEAFDEAKRRVVNDDVAVANHLRDHEMWERDWGGEPALPTGWDDDKFNKSFDHYLAAAVWAASITDENGEPIDGSNYELSDEARDELRGDFDDFVIEHRDLIARSGLSHEQVGHDFWLTRNGHGAGFWDRGIGQVGKELTEACRPYGAVELYLDPVTNEIEVM